MSRCPPWSTPPPPPAPPPPCCSPGWAPTSPATFGAAALDASLFDGCEIVVRRTIENQRIAPAPMETRAAAAAWDGDGRLTAWIPNQGAQTTQAMLARMLDLDPAVIRVITPDVGGAFGAKFGADPEHAVVCWVARQLGRPARWAETRHENLVAMTHGRAQRQTVTIGGRRDGRVTAYRLEIVQDAGAYPRFGAFLPSLTILMTPGPYAIDRAEAVADQRADQHYPGRRLPGRRPPRGDRRGRAGHGPVRRGNRHGPGRGAPEEPPAGVQ